MEQKAKNVDEHKGRQSISDIVPVEHPYLKPLFRTQADLLVYDCLLYIRVVTLPWLTELKLKDYSHLMGFIGAKLVKLLLKHFVGQNLIELSTLATIDKDPKLPYCISKSSPHIRALLFQSLELLTQPQHSTSQGVIQITQHVTYGVRKSDVDNRSVHFGRKFGRQHMLAIVLGKLVESCLERNKQYELSALVYC